LVATHKTTGAFVGKTKALAGNANDMEETAKLACPLLQRRIAKTPSSSDFRVFTVQRVYP
jgi:hypothetical protein